jgi:hypothetical protein
MLTYVDGADHYAVYKVNAGGKFIVTGKLGLAAGSNCALRPQASPGTGLVVAGSVVNDSAKNIYATLDDNSVTHKWVIGPGGITGTTENNGLWVNANSKVNPEFQPWTNDFTVALWTVLRETAKSWTYNTIGLDGLGHTITLDAGFSDKGVPVYITGPGKVVVNHVTKTFGGKNPYSGEVKVNDTATLAVNPGMKFTTGKTTFTAGTTLEVTPVASGDAALFGTLAFTGSGTVTLKAVGGSALGDGGGSWRDPVPDPRSLPAAPVRRRRRPQRRPGSPPLPAGAGSGRCCAPRRRAAGSRRRCWSHKDGAGRPVGRPRPYWLHRSR